MEISIMKPSDLEEIKDTLETSFDDFWNYNILRSELASENSTYYIAKISNNNNIVGFAGIWQAVDDMHITNIVVKKDFRQKGIGSKLLEKLIETSKQKNVISLTLEVNYKNVPAIKLYEKHGFKYVGKRKKYYNNIDDALIMTLFF